MKKVIYYFSGTGNSMRAASRIADAFINGHSFEVLEGILKEKNASLSYGKILYSVANFVVLYPPMPFPYVVNPEMKKSATIFHWDFEIAQQEKEIP